MHSVLSGKDGNAHQEQLHSTIQYSSFLPSKKNHRLRSDGVVELRLQESEVRSGVQHHIIPEDANKEQ